ncbi:MAG TPA: histidine ammonia-lyase [Caldisericia bacterium]|nr:histidine ammonia-lyase [Caldisericia bacterium]HOU07726.1 histidine ammonia-lyase [Caldisericia bacterium]HQG59537.1 histidine ammonia-lyase [Caldisericia bacterium]HQH49188.1 histidine ammonia-lyase [Caldisericia bacterium]HQJ43726.1 histidine ammonia-lyase [Caldisericia bacterium]
MRNINLGENLDFRSFLDLSHGHAKSAIGKESMEKMSDCRKMVDKVTRGDAAVYGLNTGFGSLARVKIPSGDLEKLQENLIRSHSCAVGEPLPMDVVRGAMILRANTLCLGHSGIRPEVVELLVQMVNKEIIPKVPLYGSVGASGDLALLSTIACCLIDNSDPEFMVFCHENGSWTEKHSRKALDDAGLKPVKLTSKEGLALNNGCQVSTSLGLLAIERGILSLQAWDIALATSAQALLAKSSPFDERVSIARPHKGHKKQAEIIRNLLKDSALIDFDKEKVQDAYSVRCAPQVGGAVRDAIAFALEQLSIEMNSVTDNPLIYGDVLSGGNFHGAPVAQACDLLCMSFTDLGSMSERRTFRLINSHLSGLPSFLTDNPGLSSGFMIPQYTAASLVSACKALSHPACVDSIPTCEDQEDHVSMAPISAWKLWKIVDNLSWIVSIELLTAFQALEMRLSSLGLSINDISYPTRTILGKVRQKVPYIQADQPLSSKIGLMRDMVLDKTLINPISDIWSSDVVD